MTPQEKLDLIEIKIIEAFQVLAVAETSGNEKFLEKAKEALESFEEQKEELLNSFSLEQVEQVKVPEEFKLNLGNTGPDNAGVAAEGDSFEDLPPHLKR